MQRCTNIAIRALKYNLGDDVKIGRVPDPKEIASLDGKNTFAYPGRDLVMTYFSIQDRA